MTKFLVRTCLILVVVLGQWQASSVQALTLGKTYDQSNWQEIQDYLPPFLQQWAKKNYVVFKTQEVKDLNGHMGAFRQAVFNQCRRIEGIGVVLLQNEIFRKN